MAITFWRNVQRKITTQEMDASFDTIVADIANAGLSAEMPDGQIYIGDNTNTASLETLDTSIVPETTDKRYVTDAELVVIGNTSGTNTGDNATNTTSNTYADGKVSDSITDGVTTIAPSQNAVFDALALKAPIASPTFTGTVTTPDIVVSNATVSTPTFFDAAKKLISTTAQLWGTWVQTWASKVTPVDADTIGFHDSATTFVGVKSTLLNLWTAYLKPKADLLYVALTGGQLTGALNEAPTVTIASATTTNIGGANSASVDVSGTTTITGFGTVASGIIRNVRFTGSLTLTHNATSLILPNSTNITTLNGDTAIFRSLGSGNWVCISYKNLTAITATNIPYFDGSKLVNSLLTRTSSTVTTSSQIFRALQVGIGTTSSFTAPFSTPALGDIRYKSGVIMGAGDNAGGTTPVAFAPYDPRTGWNFYRPNGGKLPYWNGLEISVGNKPIEYESTMSSLTRYWSKSYLLEIRPENPTNNGFYRCIFYVDATGVPSIIKVIKDSAGITASISAGAISITGYNCYSYVQQLGQSFPTELPELNESFSNTGLAQYWTGSEGFGVGHSSQNASAIGQFDSTTKGFLGPRMTTAQKNAVTKVEGLTVYDTDLDTLCQTNGTVWSSIGSSSLVFISSKGEFPAPSGGIITLLANTTYFINGTIDLTGDRLVCGANTTIIGGSSENCRLKSTGNPGALITSVYSLPLRNITLEAGLAVNLDGDGTTTALDWFGVNFTDCSAIGTIRDYTNFIMSDCAFLNSGGMTLDGTFGSIGFSQCLIDCNPTQIAINLASTLTVTRRFRVIYSSFVVLSGETGINVNPSATIPTESYILDTVNFSGGGTYIAGVTHTSNDSLFNNCTGITNTAVNGQAYMQANATATTVSATNTFYKVLGTTTASVDNSKFTHSNNRLTCDAVISRKYLLHCDLSFSSTATNVCEFGFYDSQLLAVRTPSKTKSTANSAGRAENISFGCVVTMVAGDYIEIHTANTSAVNDITVDQLNFIITEIR